MALLNTQPNDLQTSCFDSKTVFYFSYTGMAKETAQPQGLSGNYGLKNSFQYPQIILGIPQHYCPMNNNRY